MDALRSIRCFVLLAVAAAAGGCQPAPAPTSAWGPEETWDAHFIGDDRVGYSHTTITPDKDHIRFHNVTEIALSRFGQQTSQTIEVTSDEKPDGTPVRFRTVARSGNTVMTECAGHWERDQLHITATTQGQSAELSIPWKPEYGGPFADSQSLRRQPLQPGETRRLKAFLPSLNQLADLEFTAGEYETVKLLEGEAELLRVEVVVKARSAAGVQNIASTYWVDKQGQTLKSYLPQLKQTTYRTTQERATAPSTGSFDLVDATIVKLPKPLERPHQAQAITYKATLPEGEIDGVFVAGPSQQIKLLDKHTCEITVRALRPGDPPQLERQDDPPTDDDRSPNTLVQSDDQRVVAMAQGVAPRESSAWKLAVALEQHVHGAIRRKNFSQAFLTAAQVAKDLEGDCTEHAVLLAALCRARGIPARCAMGLVYYPEGRGFAYHMWTEAWIEDRWIPLDATLGKGGIGAGHLKLAHSNLKGADAYSAFLPVFRVLGQLKLEVVE